MAALVLVSFGVSLSGEFVWDDRPLIAENGLVKDPSRALEIVSKSFWETDDRHDRFRAFFRPAVGLTYALDHGVWGDNPIGYRLTNLLIHFLCCGLVFGIAKREGLGELSSFIAGALFAVHPVHVENVAWISGRTDLLGGLFLLAAFSVYLHAENWPRAGRGLLAALLFLVALFSKEMAIMLPALVALHVYLKDTSKRRRVFRALSAALPFVPAAALYFLARMRVLGDGGQALFTLDPLSWLATAWFVFARYCMLLIVPFPLDAHYPDPAVTSLFSARALLGLVFIAIVAAVVIYSRRRSRRVTFWILWIVVSQAPVYAFGRFGDVLLADRFLYIPSVGLAILTGVAIQAAVDLGIARLRRVALAVVTVILLLFTAQSASRSRVWRSDTLLFENMLKTSPNSALVRNNLGLARYRDGRQQEATREFERAVQLSPGFALAHNNLAAAYETHGRRQAAMRHYRSALEAAPELLEARSNAGHLEFELGLRRQGLRRLEALVESAPRYVKGVYALADVLARSGRIDESLERVEQALKLDRNHAPAYYLKGKLLHERGESGDAAAAMREFLRLSPGEGPHADAARRVIDEASVLSE